MKCVICKHGEAESGTVTVTLERDDVTIVFKDVPALICKNCGEEYVNEEIADHLLEVSENAVNSGVQVDIRHYKAA